MLSPQALSGKLQVLRRYFLCFLDEAVQQDHLIVFNGDDDAGDAVVQP